MSDWKCCGQMSDCYQCALGPKPEAPTSDLERGLLKALEECVEAEAPTDEQLLVAAGYTRKPPKDSAREWSAVEIFQAVSTGDDRELPNGKFVSANAYEKLERELRDAYREYGFNDHRLKDALDAKERELATALELNGLSFTNANRAWARVRTLEQELADLSYYRDHKATLEEVVTENNALRKRSAALVAALETIRAGRFVDFADAESIAGKALAEYGGE